MMKESVSPEKFVNNLPCSEPMCVSLDKLGVPKDSKWRGLIMYMRSIKEYDFLTNNQKRQIQQLVLEVLQTKDFSEQKFREIVQKQENILNAPCNRKLEAAFKATTELIKEFKGLLLKRSGDVKDLEGVTVETILTEGDPDKIIRKLREAFREVITTLEEDAKNLAQLSKTDTLTKLNNRRAFDEFIDEAVKKARCQNKPLSLLILDIDFFKEFNDNYGHRIGDQALAAVATIIKRYVQEKEKKEGKAFFPARYGGEEFVVVMPETELNEAGQNAEDIRKLVEAYNFVIRNAEGQIIKKGIRITISAGVAELQPQWQGALVDNLIEAADQALYAAKENGRNRVYYFTPDGCGCVNG
ncbi:GGDEF domain-containing protein [Desulfohalobiaceae bacterium Ax17]|uniref:GGDEF domain-containing protein n=1 Tax=Desulfovulcanus ferrireducens TaxID=2831190 RepID=UPI00207BAA75|nr:GGDEF domain-containing protein [Desulfovulcanus ferrireducens]MBT8764392.1 GGDEF domain-containing protein [Desulfovulcanus ferrireducens]